METNLYDLAYELEKGLRQSAELAQLKQLYKEVNDDQEAHAIFSNFREIQMRLQEKQMTGQEITEEEVQQAQKTVAIVQQHDKISKLMEAEQKMSMTIAELNKIMMKPLEEMYGPGAN
ncbi:YlbF family regulator [Bacillus xiapuensis]|uniref:YlbF family regulator n=1 Tax=Bacillus xiapuensis TaxID=2014075 RepID=UPI000C243042|nr:YlbF family regulator [Bacillus xiapuensis]